MTKISKWPSILPLAVNEAKKLHFTAHSVIAFQIRDTRSRDRSI